MRKGRSARKSRAPRSIAPTAHERDALPASGAGAKIVLGLAPHAEAKLEVLAERSLEIAEDPLCEDVAERELPTAVSTPTEVAESDVQRAEMRPPPDPDEESIPPIGDIVIEQFFSEGDISVHTPPEADAHPIAVSEKAKLKADPRVVARRARFVRYVTWAVASASVVCLAALVRTAVMPSSSSIGGQARAAAAHATAANAVVLTPPTASPKVEEPPTVAPKVEEPTAVAKVEGTAASASGEPAVPTSDAPKPAGDAVAEKTASRRALEAGKLTTAIEAGERSVALDATDAEAWLLLGAAYQEKGNLVEARRAYGSCLKEGKRGPKGECAAMLR